MLLGMSKAYVPMTARLLPGAALKPPTSAAARSASAWFRPTFGHRMLPCSYRRHHTPMKMNFVSDMFYDLRSKPLGLASKAEVKAAVSDPASVFLDVRSPEEIASASLNTNKKVICAPCSSADACPALQQLPKQKDVPVIVFCASGKRASGAKQVLESRGYTNVLNAGGLGDLDYI